MLLLVAFTGTSSFAFGYEFIDKASEMVRNELNSTEVLIRVCAILFIIFITLFISFFFTLMVARTKHKREDEYREKIKGKYEHILTGIIFNDEEDMLTEEFKESKKRVIDQFKKQYLKRRKNRQYLREHILLLHKNFSGSSAEILRNLYIELKLHKEAIKELNSPDWGVQANAVKELAQMQMKEALKKINKRSRHENPVLRIEAQVASLVLDEKDPFSFLDRDRNIITEWHQINLAANIDKLDSSLLPNFSRWFNSPNDSIVLFCIKMTLQYDQFENIPDLIGLLKHKNQDIVADAVRVLGEFSAIDADVNMLNAFRDGNQNVKLNVVEALGKCGTHEHIPFLEQQLVQNDLSIAMAAANALRLMGDDGLSVLEKNRLSPLYAVAEISNHMLDDRINL
jgi:HEAT repeat protein